MCMYPGTSAFTAALEPRRQVYKYRCCDTMLPLRQESMCVRIPDDLSIRQSEHRTFPRSHIEDVIRDANSSNCFRKLV